MKDYKESCEHNTIVDLIRNDLGIVSQKVWVEKFRYIDRIEADRINLLQVSFIPLRLKVEESSL